VGGEATEFADSSCDWNWVGNGAQGEGGQAESPATPLTNCEGPKWGASGGGRGISGRKDRETKKKILKKN